MPGEKLVYVPVFMDTQFLRPESKINEFSLEYGLQDKFVVFYAGNLGLTQGLESLVEVAEELADISELLIVIVGDGAFRPVLERTVAASGVENVLMLPYQPWERIRCTYAAADVCVSPIKEGFNYDTVPSKIYSALAAGRAVVVAAEEDTEAAMLVRESHAGLVVSPGSARELARAIREIHSHPEMLTDMGRKGREWVEANHDRVSVLANYERILVDNRAAGTVGRQ